MVRETERETNERQNERQTERHYESETVCAKKVFMHKPSLWKIHAYDADFKLKAVTLAVNKPLHGN